MLMVVGTDTVTTVSGSLSSGSGVISTGADDDDTLCWSPAPMAGASPGWESDVAEPPPRPPRPRRRREPLAANC